MTDGFQLGPKAISQVRAIVKDFETRIMRSFSERPHGAADFIVLEGKLTETLSAASAGGATAQTASMDVYRKNWGTGTWEDSGVDITVTNRDVGLSASSGDFIMVLHVNGEWRPFWVSC